MTKVSVIVPVFNPGADIDELIDSLLGQTMPPAEREFVFVDDGSTDGTGERLDGLAAEHAEVVVEHIPNSGWPGRPRNVGLDLARGEFVFFADNDDWLERDALAGLYAVAKAERADVVIGKVVGHGVRRQIPNIFKQDRHGLDAHNVPLKLLTPHKLFRRALLEQHGIRFPEGKRRLEDHLFVVPAFLAAERISVLASRPVYHWAVRRGAGNASAQRAEIDSHFASLRELLALIDAGTEPGKVRDRYYLQWYRSKLLKRLGHVDGHFADEDYRMQFYEMARELINDRFPPRLDDRLPYRFRLRARLTRRDDVRGLEQLVAYESMLRLRARVLDARASGPMAVLRIEAGLLREGRPALRIAQRGDRLLWEPPEGLRLEDDERDLTAQLDGRVHVGLRSQDDETEWMVPTRSTTELPRARARNPVVTAAARIDAGVAAAGAPLPLGRYDVRVHLSLASFSRNGAARAEGEPLTITVSPAGHVSVSLRGTRVSRWLARGTRPLARAARKAWRRASTAGRS